MIPVAPRMFLFGTLLALGIALLPATARTETFVGTNIDSRILVGWQVHPADIQPMMPEGWAPVPFPSGPLKGANLLMFLIDRHLQLDPGGKPGTPPNSRAASFATLARADEGDEVRLFVLKIYATPSDYDPYGNAEQAVITRTTKTDGPADQGRTRYENWRIQPAGGGDMGFYLDYTAGTRSWAASKARPFSNTDPEFSRIYRYEQMVDVAMSEPLGKALNGGFNFTTSVPELMELFDGNQKAVAIMDVPVYVRKVYLP